ncbi:MAG: DUF4824 family protein, partial [Nitrospirae bacterium]|nr:DUF4824 family protein [Nitrospirota bacterium]
MIKWSSRYTLAMGIALIISTNAVVLIGAQYNRSGEPDASVTLTERELALPYSYGFGRENSGLSLRLVWSVMTKDQKTYNGIYNFMRYRGSAGWLDKNKLATLGFDVTDDPDTLGGKRHYQKVLPREVLFVLEYDGEAYQQMLNQAKQHLQEEEALLSGNPGKKEFVDRVKDAQRELYREQQVYSRLFIIDAGTDHGDLREKYTDRSRYMIARGQVRIMLENRTGQKPYVTGYVEGVSIQDVNVPLAYRHILDPFLASRSPLGNDS